MYYSYVEIEYVATSFSPARTDLALKLFNLQQPKLLFWDKSWMGLCFDSTAQVKLNLQSAG